jgi:hypothetical protein
MAKARKSVAALKKSSSRRGKTSTKPVRKKMAKRTAAKARNSKSRARALKAASKPQASKNLYFFEVDEYGTISEPDFDEPKINSDIFDNISIDKLTTPAKIISELEFYGALVDHFRGLAQDEHEELIRRIELKDYRDDKKLEQMKRLAEALEDEDDGWEEWIKIEGSEGVPRIRKMVVDWLAAPIEWGEDMPDNASSQGSAKRFFENEDGATLDKLGVSIVEGENRQHLLCGGTRKTS